MKEREEGFVHVAEKVAIEKLLILLHTSHFYAYTQIITHKIAADDVSVEKLIKEGQLEEGVEV